MTVKSVSRITAVQFQHLVVTRNLGHNGRRRDGRTPSVSTDYSTLREEQLWNPETVNQDKVR
jgi:hypothetical protein